MKRWQSILLGVVVTVGTLYYALHGIAWDQVGTVIAHGKYIFVVPTMILGLISMIFRAYRWRALLKGRITIGHSINIVNAGYLFNTILPLRLGEVVRGYLATRLQPPISIFTALSSVVLERIADVMFMVILIALAVTTAPVAPEIAGGAAISGVLGILVIITLAVFAARRSLAHALLDRIFRLIPVLERLNLRGLLDRVLDGIAPLGSLRDALTLLGWTSVGWIVSLVSTYILLFTFFDHPTVFAAVLLTVVGSLAVAVPAMPGNVGPFEAAVIFGMTSSGFVLASDPQQQASALAYAVLLHITYIALYVIFGIIGLWQEHISLGEVLRSARQLATRPKDKQEKIDAAPGSVAL